MGLPVATLSSQVVGVDTHVVLVPTPGGPVPTPLPHPFSGQVLSGTATTVLAGGMPVATVDSTALNLPPHLPTPPGATWMRPPSDQGRIVSGSLTVQVGGKGVARVGDPVATCNDPVDVPVSSVVGPAGTVIIG